MEKEIIGMEKKRVTGNKKATGIVKKRIRRNKQEEYSIEGKKDRRRKS